MFEGIPLEQFPWAYLVVEQRQFEGDLQPIVSVEAQRIEFDIVDWEVAA
tara:strand:- start:222 stop:368 length:147 start_codon:yes stop_codon:yes gene_type:complete